MLWKKKKMPEMEPFVEPRPHHYEFAHRCMRICCRNDPMAFFAIMGSDERRGFIQAMCNTVSQVCKSDAENPMNPDDITVRTGCLLDHPTIVVTMPEPAGVTEAHMVCIVLTSPLSDDTPPEGMTFRYFTLEFGWARRGEKETVLCEWTDSAHNNYGPGPAPEPRAFLDAVRRRLDAERSSPG